MDEPSACRPPKRVQDKPKQIVGRRPTLLCLVLASLLAVAADNGFAVQPTIVDAVTPGGPGVLTKRIDWLVASSQRTYHHIILPPRIAIGDTITLSFGSSTKTYRFLVARITLNGNHCKIFSQAEVHHRRDRIDVTPCYAVDEGR